MEIKHGVRAPCKDADEFWGSLFDTDGIAADTFVFGLFVKKL